MSCHMIWKKPICVIEKNALVSGWFSCTYCMYIFIVEVYHCFVKSSYLKYVRTQNWLRQILELFKDKNPDLEKARCWFDTDFCTSEHLSFLHPWTCLRSETFFSSCWSSDGTKAQKNNTAYCVGRCQATCLANSAPPVLFSDRCLKFIFFFLYFWHVSQ